jgi:ribonuclease P protein component
MKRAGNIKRARDISRIYKYGYKWECPVLKIYYLQNGIKRNRYGILVSRENGNAVSRNRLKRTTREFFCQEKAIVPHHYDILIKLISKNAKIKQKDLNDGLKEWCTSIKR